MGIIVATGMPLAIAPDMGMEDMVIGICAFMSNIPVR